MMRKGIGIFVVAASLAVPSIAAAGPITTGVWSPLTGPFLDGGQFWDNASVDCGDPALPCSGGSIVFNAFGASGPIEYLHDGAGNAAPFRFDEAVSLTDLGGLTILVPPGTLAQDADGSFTFTSGIPGHVSNSWTNYQQFAIFRQTLPGAIRYFIAVEDIRFDLPAPPPYFADGDFNDDLVSFRVATQAAPEPALLLLLGTGLAAASRRFRRAPR
jgi:hypothetical protein